MSTAAAVIDLDSYRAARRAGPRAAMAARTPAPAPLGPQLACAPYWIVWVPAWPVR